MKKKLYFTLFILIVLCCIYYYWQNRYVKLYPVVLKENYQPLIIFHNQLFKIAEPHEVPVDYYKNIKYVMDRTSQDYIIKDGEIYIRYKLMNDMEMIWNYTMRTSDPLYFKEQREMDSINRIYKKQYEDSIRKLKL